jgi:hypothetical protein
LDNFFTEIAVRAHFLDIVARLLTPKGVEDTIDIAREMDYNFPDNAKFAETLKDILIQ